MRGRDEVRRAGGEVVLVGQGTADFARAFRQETGWAGTLVVDGDAQAYRAAGLRRTGILGHLRPGALRGYRAARREGHRNTAVRGDAWLQGGTFVIAPGDRTAYAWRDVVGSDPAPIEDVLRRLTEAARATAPGT